MHEVNESASHPMHGEQENKAHPPVSADLTKGRVGMGCGCEDWALPRDLLCPVRPLAHALAILTCPKALSHYSQKLAKSHQ